MDTLKTFGALCLLFLVPETSDEDKQILNWKYYRQETTFACEYDRKTLYKQNFLKRLGEPLWSLLNEL